MKIRDLKIDNYVVVNDLGAGKYSSGMRVIGKVVKIDPCGNSAIIESLPKHRYEITDFNDFDLWSNYIESKTESVSKVGLRNLNVGDWIQYFENNGQSEYGKYIKKVVKMHKFKTVLELEKINGVHVYIDENTDFIRIPAEWAEKLEKLRKEKIKEAQEMLIGINDVYESSDLQQRKRKEENTALFKIKDLKVGYKIEILGDRMTGEVSKISSNGKSAQIRVDDGVYRDITDNNDFTILEWNATPQYAEDMVNHPSHYNYGDIEVINFIEQVTKHYNPNVAYHIGNAIKYLARSPHKNGKEDIDKARWYIERAFENWDK